MLPPCLEADSTPPPSCLTPMSIQLMAPRQKELGVSTYLTNVSGPNAENKTHTFERNSSHWIHQDEALSMQMHCLCEQVVPSELGSARIVVSPYTNMAAGTFDSNRVHCEQSVLRECVTEQYTVVKKR